MSDVQDAKSDYDLWLMAWGLQDTPDIRDAFLAGHEYARDRAADESWERDMGDDL
jgi:hypothetical protein